MAMFAAVVVVIGVFLLVFSPLFIEHFIAMKRSKFDHSNIAALTTANYDEVVNGDNPVLVWCFQNRYDAFTMSRSWVARHQMFEKVAAVHRGRLEIYKLDPDEQETLTNLLRPRLEGMDRGHGDKLVLFSKGKVIARLTAYKPQADEVEFFIRKALGGALTEEDKE
jgi:hypothetical protein